MSVSFLNSTIAASACSSANIPYPSLAGAEILALETSLVANFSEYIHIGYYTNHGAVNVTDVTYCNVTVTYSHPCENDTLTFMAFLP